MFQFAVRLKAAKACCRSLNRDGFGGIQQRCEQALASLHLAQTNLLSDPSPINHQAELLAREYWQRMDTALETFYRQKSRVQWVDLGDANTTFFHRRVVANFHRDFISCLKDDNGSLIFDVQSLQLMTVSFYRNLLGTRNDSITAPSLPFLQDLHSFRSSPSQNLFLSSIPSPDSILAIIQHMPHNKAPGPDGFPIEFYRSTWDIVGQDIINAVTEFFRSGKLLKELNATALTLIPKKEGACSLTDYRPISCCNHFYKIISTILAGRLKIMLPQIVQKNQVGFVHGRQLCENILLASELINKFNKRGPVTRGCLKIDLTKAFDNIHWDFVLQSLRSFALPTTFISWIKECITTTSFSINFNGDLTGFFRGEKGLRQGDPISSYLFVIAMDTLSKLLDRAVASGRIRLHPSCHNPVISHLSFADDLLIFFDGSDTSLQAILSVLDDFYRMSGLGVNLLKSTLFLDGNNPNVLHHLASKHGLSQGTLPVKYLGVPLTPNKMKTADFQPLLENIQTRFTSWTTRHLSFAGRLQLLQSVINSVINFWASIFLLPNQCLLQIERLCNAFLWSGNTQSGKKAKVSWASVCTPKSSGGLGLRRLARWNTVLGLKLIWLLFSNSGSLWVSWVHSNLLASTSLWEAPHPHPLGSWMWNEILKIRDVARPFILCRVGSGSTCSFWHDNWTGLGSLFSLLGRSAISITGIHKDSSVLHATHNDPPSWSLSTRSRNPVIMFLQENLPDAPSLLTSSSPDSYHWMPPGADPHQSCSRFSASKTFLSLNPPPPEVPWHKQVWFSGRIPKHAFTTWLAVINRLATRDRIRRYAPSTPSTCLLCSSSDESREHLFFSCSYSSSLLRHVLQMSPTHLDLHHLLQWLPHSSSCNQLRLIGHLALQATIYSIWRERNSRFHTSTSRPVSLLARDIDITIRAKLYALSRSTATSSPSLLEVWFGIQLHHYHFSQ